jgi:AraC-like DNA-binding protein
LDYKDSRLERIEMLAPPDHFRIRLFSDSMVPRAQSFHAWNRLLNKWLVHADGRSLEKDEFPVSVRLRALPDLRYGWGAIGASHYERSRSVTANENDDVLLFVNLGSECIGNRAGRETRLAPGQAYVVSCCETGAYTRPTGGDLLCVRTQREGLQRLTPRLDDKMGSVIPAESESLRLLSSYLRTIGDTEPLTEETVRRLVTQHVQALLALALGGLSGVGEAAQQGGVRVARLRMAKAIIQKHATDPDLCADFVAKQMRISPRSLQRLFESEGVTFSGFVTQERLTKAYSELADVQNRARSIAGIALNCGFGDISYFNRQFRARYGTTPSEIRHYELVASDTCRAKKLGLSLPGRRL